MASHSLHRVTNLCCYLSGLNSVVTFQSVLLFISDFYICAWYKHITERLLWLCVLENTIHYIGSIIGISVDFSPKPSVIGSGQKYLISTPLPKLSSYIISLAFPLAWMPVNNLSLKLSIELMTFSTNNNKQK